MALAETKDGSMRLVEIKCNLGGHIRRVFIVPDRVIALEEFGGGAATEIFVDGRPEPYWTATSPGVVARKLRGE